MYKLLSTVIERILTETTEQKCFCLVLIMAWTLIPLINGIRSTIVEMLRILWYEIIFHRLENKYLVTTAFSLNSYTHLLGVDGVKTCSVCYSSQKLRLIMRYSDVNKFALGHSMMSKWFIRQKQVGQSVSRVHIKFPLTEEKYQRLTYSPLVTVSPFQCSKYPLKQSVC